MQEYSFQITIEKEFFYNEESAYGIYSFKTEDEIPYCKSNNFDNYKHSTILGNMQKLNIGSQYSVSAIPAFNNKYKQWQWDLSNIKVDIPRTLEEQQNFLKALVTENQAKNIVEIYPNFIEDVIEQKELDYTVVKGMSEKSWTLIQKKIIENYGFLDAFTILQPYGITFNMVKKLAQNETNPALLKQHLLENPYIMMKINGLGFKKVDDLALKIKPSLKVSEYRVVAFLHYYLNEIGESQGHCWVTAKTLLNSIQDNIIECTQIAKDFIKSESQKTENRFLYIHENKIGLYSTYIKEKEIIEKLNLINNCPSLPQFDNIEVKIQETEKEQGFNFTDEQKQAILNTLKSNVSIICGKAGVGKTCTSRALLKIFSQRYKVACCSLSAKAAQRITEATGFFAETIHRLLKGGYNMEFSYNNENPLPYDLIFVDECSMLNINIFHSLTMALRPDAKLILCGDNKQLSPIGCGNVFENLLSYTDRFNCIFLTKVMRQAEMSGILKDANIIRDGFSPIARPQERIVTGELQDMCYIFKEDKEEIFNAAIKNYLNGVKRYGVDNAVIITPRKQNCQNSTSEFNKKIQEILLGDENQCIKLRNRIFKLGAKVIHKVNNYEKGVFNGEIGYIVEVRGKEKDGSGNEAIVEFPFKTGKKDILYSKKDFEELDLAYAMTAHSAQGSGYDVVIGVIDNSHYILLDTCMLYTIITRAKKRCLLVSEPSAFRLGISNNKTVKRQTWTALKIF